MPGAPTPSITLPLLQQVLATGCPTAPEQLLQQCRDEGVRPWLDFLTGQLRPFRSGPESVPLSVWQERLQQLLRAFALEGSGEGDDDLEMDALRAIAGFLEGLSLTTAIDDQHLDAGRGACLWLSRGYW